MVRRVPGDMKEAVDKALDEAKSRTGAEIILVVVPRSDHYQAQVTAGGFALGSLAALWLWAAHITGAFPVLFGAQIAAMALANAFPPLHGLFVRMIPRRIRHHHAARAAMQEYLFETRNLPAQKPAVMLYVSLAERYAHVLHSRAVPEKVPAGTWDAVIAGFTGAMKNKEGLQAACTAAIGDMARALEGPFPAKA